MTLSLVAALEVVDQGEVEATWPLMLMLVMCHGLLITAIGVSKWVEATSGSSTNDSPYTNNPRQSPFCIMFLLSTLLFCCLSFSVHFPSVLCQF